MALFSVGLNTPEFRITSVSRFGGGGDPPGSDPPNMPVAGLTLETRTVQMVKIFLSALYADNFRAFDKVLPR